LQTFYNPMTDEPTNDQDAVTLALFCALIAPNDDKAMECCALAALIASVAHFTNEQAEAAKASAEAWFNVLIGGGEVMSA